MTSTNYERTYSNIVNLKILGSPSASYFDLNPPEDLAYNGEAKKATVVVIGVPGMGDIKAIHSYDSDGNPLENPSTEVGIYTVAIDVAAGDTYTEAYGITNETWSFVSTIKG